MYTYLHKMKIDSDTGLNHKPYIFNNKIVNTQKSIHIWKVKVCQNESFCSNIWKKRLRTTYVYLIRAERRWKRCEASLWLFVGKILQNTFLGQNKDMFMIIRRKNWIPFSATFVTNSHDTLHPLPYLNIYLLRKTDSRKK